MTFWRSDSDKFLSWNQWFDWLKMHSNSLSSKLFNCIIFLSLISTYLVCERLSVMQRLPESGKAEFVLEFGQKHPVWNWSRRPLLWKFKYIKYLFTLSFDYIRTLPPPSPWKFKFRQILALWVLTTSEHPPPHSNLGRSWHFEFWLHQNTPPPAPFKF